MRKLTAGLLGASLISVSCSVLYAVSVVRPEQEPPRASDLGYRLSSPETETLAVTVTNHGTARTSGDAVLVVTAPQWSELNGRPARCGADGANRTAVCPVAAGLAPGRSVTWSLPLNVSDSISTGDRLPAGSVTIQNAGDRDARDNHGMFGLDITDAWWNWFAWYYAFTPSDDGTVDLTVPSSITAGRREARNGPGEVFGVPRGDLARVPVG